MVLMRKKEARKKERKKSTGRIYSNSTEGISSTKS